MQKKNTKKVNFLIFFLRPTNFLNLCLERHISHLKNISFNKKNFFSCTSQKKVVPLRAKMILL